MLGVVECYFVGLLVWLVWCRWKLYYGLGYECGEVYCVEIGLDYVLCFCVVVDFGEDVVEDV